MFNGNCGKCFMMLKKWNEYMNKQKNINVEVVFIARSDDGFEMLKFVLEKDLKVNRPIFFDYNDEFRKKNKLLDLSVDVLVLDKNNTISSTGVNIVNIEEFMKKNVVTFH